MTTTGFGDVHATGQLGRVLVSAVYVFNVVYVALLADEVSRELRSRRSPRTDQRGKSA